MNFSYNGACALNLGLFFISIPGLAWVVFTQVADTTHGTNLSGGTQFASSESESGQEKESENHLRETKSGVQSGSVAL